MHDQTAISPLIHRGSCLCGAVRFAYHGEIDTVIACHCLKCRKAQGTPFVTNAPLETARMEWLSGRDHLKSYESSPGKQRWFCQNCGSPMYSQKAELPEILRLRVGTLETPLSCDGVSAHIFIADKASWWTIQDDAPQWPQWPPAT